MATGEVDELRLGRLTSVSESSATVESPLPGGATKLEPQEAALQQATSAAESGWVESGQPKRQHRTPDFDSEIYSLGGIMYFLLTGVALSAEASGVSQVFRVSKTIAELARSDTSSQFRSASTGLGRARRDDSELPTKN